ncbi:hypothetical protein ACYPKM_05510 [Pseudomonas aeruginosa]
MRKINAMSADSILSFGQHLYADALLEAVGQGKRNLPETHPHLMVRAVMQVRESTLAGTADELFAKSMRRGDHGIAALCLRPDLIWSDLPRPQAGSLCSDDRKYPISLSLEEYHGAMYSMGPTSMVIKIIGSEFVARVRKQNCVLNTAHLKFFAGPLGMEMLTRDQTRVGQTEHFKAFADLATSLIEATQEACPLGYLTLDNLITGYGTSAEHLDRFLRNLHLLGETKIDGVFSRYKAGILKSVDKLLSGTPMARHCGDLCAILLSDYEPFQSFQAELMKRLCPEDSSKFAVLERLASLAGLVEEGTTCFQNVLKTIPPERVQPIVTKGGDIQFLKAHGYPVCDFDVKTLPRAAKVVMASTTLSL